MYETGTSGSEQVKVLWCGVKGHVNFCSAGVQKCTMTVSMMGTICYWPQQQIKIKA